MSTSTAPNNLYVIGLHFEHYNTRNQLGTHIPRPRLSWNFENAPQGFQQSGYEVELCEQRLHNADDGTITIRVESKNNILVPFPREQDLQPRERISVRVRAWGQHPTVLSAWSEAVSIEGGLMARELWTAELISSPWAYADDKPQPEELFRKQFHAAINHDDAADTGTRRASTARLYITAQGVYEAEINGVRVGDDILAPGWTCYGSRLRYQCYDVLEHLRKSARGSRSASHVLGVRVAEGWFCGRLGWGVGKRNIFGDRPALMAQLEIGYSDGSLEVLAKTDDSWFVTQGPALLAELYDGEKYDGRLEIPGWSSSEILPAVPNSTTNSDRSWQKAMSRGSLPATVQLITGEAEPVRRMETIRPVKQLTTPQGYTVLDFGQNMVGHCRIRISGPAGTTVTLRHAEVLEHGELGIRPLRCAANYDEYTLRGTGAVEQWQPHFTFHGFRYVQVCGWPSNDGNMDLLSHIDGIVCHTDMTPSGDFTCSDTLISQFHKNVTWSMRGNFLSIPTDCPQRDERLGWTGDLAVFAPTATLLYKCTAMLQGWLRDVSVEQNRNGGTSTLVVPNVLDGVAPWGHHPPTAIWGDVVVLAPWALYQETGDLDILREQYPSIKAWMAAIPRNTTSNTHLWDAQLFQLGDWLDPAAPPENPPAAKTDAQLVANAFLIHCLDITTRVASLLTLPDDHQKYHTDLQHARAEFANEYITPSGRLISDSQTAYALAIVFSLFPSESRALQLKRAGERLAEIVRQNNFKIGTGFAGTPYILEALTLAGQAQVAYAMLYSQECPSWLYAVKMGAITVWERWDSMLSDGTVNPGEMTSFNHYALGAVARWLWERAAGLQRVDAGWKRIRFEPIIGGELTHVEAGHDTPFGRAGISWKLEGGDGDGNGEGRKLVMDVKVPPNTTAEVVFPPGSGLEPTEVASGRHSFRVSVERYEWPVKSISLFS